MHGAVTVDTALRPHLSRGGSSPTHVQKHQVSALPATQPPHLKNTITCGKTEEEPSFENKYLRSEKQEICLETQSLLLTRKACHYSLSQSL